jgi:hypothetical protein
VVVVTMRLRAIDLPHAERFLLVLGEVDEGEVESLHRLGLALSDEVNRWGGVGPWVFATRVDLEEEITSQGTSQVRAWLVDQLDVPIELGEAGRP